jgi:hypothetical protein
MVAERAFASVNMVEPAVCGAARAGMINLWDEATEADNRE